MCTEAGSAQNLLAKEGCDEELAHIAFVTVQGI